MNVYKIIEMILFININIVNIILATFIFGQGDDYSIFVTEGALYEYKNGKKNRMHYAGDGSGNPLLVLRK